MARHKYEVFVRSKEDDACIAHFYKPTLSEAKAAIILGTYDDELHQDIVEPHSFTYAGSRHIAQVKRIY